MSYLRGKRYEAEKKPKGGDRRSEKSKGHAAPLIESTAEKVGEQFGVDQATIKRDAAFARAVDMAGVGLDSGASKAETVGAKT